MQEALHSLPFGRNLLSAPRHSHVHIPPNRPSIPSAPSAAHVTKRLTAKVKVFSSCTQSVQRLL